MSTLIRPTDIPEVDEVRTVECGSTDSNPSILQYSLGKINESVESCFPTLEKNTIRHFFTCGHWSTHELVQHILQMIGPAEVLISVWSISEHAARVLVDMLDKGLITKLEAVVDYRAKNRHPSAHQLAVHSFTKLHTFPCHAKLTVIKNQEWNISINGSANYTNNPRPEAGILDTHDTTAEFYETYIRQMINNSNPFE